MRNCFLLRFPGESKVGIADLTPEMLPDTWTINRICIPEAFQGSGGGRRLLKMILEEADAEQITLSLEINPYGQMNYEQLEAWYMRNGFKPSKKYFGFYVRKPVVQENAHL